MWWSLASSGYPPLFYNAERTHTEKKTLKLVKFDEIDSAQFDEYAGEWEKECQRIVPWSCNRKDRNFDEMKRTWQNDETEEVVSRGLVPSTLFFLLTIHGGSWAQFTSGTISTKTGGSMAATSDTG
jgi:hypothetical protein